MRGLVGDEAEFRLLFIDPASQAVRRHEIEEGYQLGQISALTELKIQTITQRLLRETRPGRTGPSAAEGLR